MLAEEEIVFAITLTPSGSPSADPVNPLTRFKYSHPLVS